jgi:hypothetical protein
MDDVTIVDEFDGNEDVSSKSEKTTNLLKWSYIFQLCKYYDFFRIVYLIFD